MDKINGEIAGLIDVYGKLLGEKTCEMMELYYTDDLSLSEIAENTGMTRQSVHETIKRAEQKLLSAEAQLRFAAKIDETRRQATLINSTGNLGTAKTAAAKILTAWEE